MTCKGSPIGCGCPLVFPLPICNASGQTSIRYRIGHFVAFRNQLLQPLAGETELTDWRPDAPGDLAVQMMEWWAYLGDILTFYNERIANEAYLRTAILPESVNHLVQILGYRPKPALGAKGSLAALLSQGARLPVTLPAGLQVQSKPPPGQAPQIFQAEQTTPILLPDVIAAVVSPKNQPLLGDEGNSVWLAGKVSGIKPAERLLLINASALTAQTVSREDYAWVAVVNASPETDPLGNPVTQVSFTTLAGSLQGGAQAVNYVLLRAAQSAPLWGFPVLTAAVSVVEQSGAAATLITMAGVARSLGPGSLLLLDVADAATRTAQSALNDFCAAFVGSLQAQDLASAFNTGAGATSDGEFQYCFATGVAATFCAAYRSKAVASGSAAAAWNAALNAAQAVAGTAGTFGQIAAAAFSAAFSRNLSNTAIAAGSAAAQAAADTLFNQSVDCATAFTAGLVSGFAAAEVPLETGFSAECIDFSATFGTLFTNSLTTGTDPADAATAAAGGVVAALTLLTPFPAIVASYGEVVWYANGDGPYPPKQSAPPAPIGLPVSQIGFASLDSTGGAAALWDENLSQVIVRWAWTPVGRLVPVVTANDLTWNGGNTVLVPSPGAARFPTLPAAVLLEDAAGNAVSAIATASADGTGGITLDNVLPQPAPQLASPVSVFFNPVSVSRGKSVSDEVLGNGNPSLAGQDFTLQQSPVTYYFDSASVSGPNFTSTVDVRVNGVLWQEQQSFYGCGQNEQVYVLHEDDRGQTHVSFGDGVNGALLPTGTNNIVATYRYGAGAAAPTAETLTVVLTPTPGLKSVRNPLQPTGGGDPDQPSDLRELAPRSVLTFNRAVSLDDYAALAMTASGVMQALADYVFDPSSQRPMVTLWIAGDNDAVNAAAQVLSATAMPNQKLKILAATALPVTLSLTYLRDPRYADPDVLSALTNALLDPNDGLLGAKVLGIGQPIYQSQIAARCLAVPGVQAIQHVTLTGDTGELPLPRRRALWRYGAPLQPLGCTGQGWSPGPGNYIVVPNDGRHLQLMGSLGS